MEKDKARYLYLDLPSLQNILANFGSLISYNNSDKKTIIAKFSARRYDIRSFSHAYLRSTLGVVLGFNQARAASIVFSFFAIKQFSELKESIFMVIN
ncbi:hypothetical protein HYU06_04370 [Candidatus Woesearchaeota archaeon]|nr:hypothetical protein [Candidatus Woesearchaeota archaeon]